MIIAHRIQLLPNNHQAAHFRKACGVARFTWNWALAEWERQYRAGEKPNALALKKQFLARIDDEWSWMREVANHVYHQPFNDLSAAWQRYFKKLTRRPRFKKRGKSRDSFYLANTCLGFTSNRVRITKLGEVRLREPLRFQGKLMSARISREADKWFIAASIEMPDVTIPTHKAPHRTTGVDLGVSAWATLANGVKATMPDTKRHYRRYQRYQRQQARKCWAALVAMGLDPRKPIPKGTRLPVSNRLRALRVKSQRCYRRITGIRANATHQLTASLVKQWSVIGIEGLNVKGMTASARGTIEAPGRNVRQKAGLNGSVLNNNFGEFRR